MKNKMKKLVVASGLSLAAIYAYNKFVEANSTRKNLLKTENGVFYDSRSCGSNLPIDADANGAYNIARKGLWVLRQIQNSNPNDKLRLTLSNKEWLQFVQDKSNFE